MLTKRDKQFILQVQIAIVFLQSILILWLIKTEWGEHALTVLGVIIYIAITDYLFYKLCLLIVDKIKKYKEEKDAHRL